MKATYEEVIGVCEKEEKDMLAIQKGASFRKPKRNRTNLLSSANEKDIALLNSKTKRNRGLSNLNYKRVFGED